LTSEQLEAARAERMRQNGLGTLTLEDARTWIEETGLCLFLPKRQFPSSVAPSFVEAIAGRQDSTPDPKQIALAEELLVRLELEGVAVRLNLLGQPGEQPDFVVASWVLPYVYALRGDRDWRRSPQLTGSRQVSQLAVLAYKQLEAGDASISQLKQALGREVSETAVLRAITELWQQLRIIPVISAPGHAAKWQLLRIRFQRAIAEGASTSQVTAISVLASIYLQAVIAASMEEVELFLAPLTARSKIREVLRGLVATRQVHTISLGHAPHFYVAGTLPEFAPATSLYASSSMPASAYFTRTFDREEEHSSPAISLPISSNAHTPGKHEAEKPLAPRRPAAETQPEPTRPHFSRPAHQSRDRKPAATGRLGQSSSTNGRPVRRSVESRTQGPRKQGSSRPASTNRWNQSAPKKANGNGKLNGSQNTIRSGNGTRLNGRTANGSHQSQSGKSAGTTWNKIAAAKRNGHANGAKSAPKPGGAARKGSIARKDSRPAHGARKPMATAGASSKRFEFGARSKQATKKRG
jgi:23S rRNA pseudouridine2605 synthase